MVDQSLAKIFFLMGPYVFLQKHRKKKKQKNNNLKAFDNPMYIILKIQVLRY
jgi:hypothetical protein